MKAIAAILILSLGACVVHGLLWRDSPSAPGARYACTGFAVYSGEPIYGMNFDYPDLEMRVSIRPSEGMKVFQLEFKEGNQFNSVVGMNSRGLFASNQMLLPDTPFESPGAGTIATWQVHSDALLRFGTTEQVRAHVRDKRVVNSGISLHNLIADAQGDAMVVEPGSAGNVITPIAGKFIVMTNFAVGNFAGKEYRATTGAGADRYQTAYRLISANLPSFGYDQAFEVLRQTAQQGSFGTQASMVFKPASGEIYLALKRDFAKVWKISLGQGTIEAYSGFGSAAKASLGAAGILSSELLAGKVSIAGNKTAATEVGLAVAVAAGISALLWRRHHGS